MTKSILLVIFLSLLISISAISKNALSSNLDNIPYSLNALLPPVDTPDVGVSIIVSPKDTCIDILNPPILTIRIKNYGNITVDSFPVSQSADNFGPGTTTEIIYDSILPGDSLDFTFQTPILIPLGNLIYICAKAELASDNNSWNDEFCDNYWPCWMSTNDNDIDEYVPIVYPNPFTKSSTLSLNSPHQCQASLSILSLDGRLIMHKQIELETGENQVEILMENQDPGLYFYILEMKGQTFSGKLILH